MNQIIRLRLSPKNELYVRGEQDLWIKFSPNGEYWDAHYGDELSDNHVTNWPEVNFTSFWSTNG